MAVVGAAFVAAASGVPVPPLGADVVPGAGAATSYDSDGGGNCSFPPSDAGGLDVALSEVEYGTADACGGYLDVTGPTGTVRVEITNRCPECGVGHVDMSRTAFARVAPLEAGQVAVSYALVHNPPLAEPMALRVKEGSSQWWMQIQVIDHGNPLAGVELRQGDSWRSLSPTQHNYWTAEEPGPGPGPPVPPAPPPPPPTVAQVVPTTTVPATTATPSTTVPSVAPPSTAPGTAQAVEGSFTSADVDDGPGVRARLLRALPGAAAVAGITGTLLVRRRRRQRPPAAT